jgi:class 3 adenylate cyclase
MSRLDCINNRNIKIIAMYLESKLGTFHSLFDALAYPVHEYTCPEDFFLNEDEWTTYENFERIFRSARKKMDDPDFYFNCGASTARLRSWGRFHYFARVFSSPDDGFKKVPFFNRHFDDTKDIEVVLPPTYDRQLKKIRTLLKVDFHPDVDPHRDYIGDPYLRGIISSIPTIWGVEPAAVSQPLNPYNPEILFNQEPEFIPFGLEVRLEGDHMTLRDPEDGQRREVGEKVFLEPEVVEGQRVFLGKYSRPSQDISPDAGDKGGAILITKDVMAAGRPLLTAGQIFMAPYFILDVTYNRSFFLHRFYHVFKIRSHQKDSGKELIDTINQLRMSMEAKNEAHRSLEEANAQLQEAKATLDEYSKELERKVEERTAELRKAQQELLEFNRHLQEKVKTQVTQLERYNELRRYLSPKLTERILIGEHAFGPQSQRKLLTIVFTDIRGFSALTESLEPEEISYLLNRYLTEMIECVHHHDGTLNKIIGDGLLVFFGDPIPMEDHARRAVRMAVDMQKKVGHLADEWHQYGLPLGVGMGINTGYVTVGNIGSDMHRDYTVIGNQVNVAARLESMAKAGQILISQRTYSHVKDMVAVEAVGEIQIKGIHSPVKTYNVIW